MWNWAAAPSTGDNNSPTIKSPHGYCLIHVRQVFVSQLNFDKLPFYCSEFVFNSFCPLVVTMILIGFQSNGLIPPFLSLLPSRILSIFFFFVINFTLFLCLHPFCSLLCLHPLFPLPPFLSPSSPSPLCKSSLQHCEWLQRQTGSKEPSGTRLFKRLLLPLPLHFVLFIFYLSSSSASSSSSSYCSRCYSNSSSSSSASSSSFCCYCCCSSSSSCCCCWSCCSFCCSHCRCFVVVVVVVVVVVLHLQSPFSFSRLFLFFFFFFFFFFPSD